MKDTHAYMERLANIFKKYKYVALVAAVGLLLIAWPFGGSADPPASADTLGEQASAYEEVIPELEGQLAALLVKVDGVGRVEVMLSLHSDMEYVYVDTYSRVFDEKNSSDGSSEKTIDESVDYVKEKTKDGSEALVIRKRIYPVYKGAVIVCDGADNAGIQLKVINAVSAVTGLSSDRITVMKMK